jgi:hypothetical protein
MNIMKDLQALINRVPKKGCFLMDNVMVHAGKVQCGSWYAEGTEPPGVLPMIPVWVVEDASSMPIHRAVFMEPMEVALHMLRILDQEIPGETNEETAQRRHLLISDQASEEEQS